MNASDIGWLVTGMSAGVVLATLVLLIGNYLDDRRDQLAGKQALARIRKAEATTGWHQILATRNVP
ncbi:hypothetical protein [Streptomyces sp. NPDC059979]|uniref:hypothetical protein n=1 Tax=Streptomyces sp. NPDC059979 TaxID=3347021 RepID=UPI0036D0D224